jgi:hypothetical protein
MTASALLPLDTQKSLNPSIGRLLKFTQLHLS